jgi:hypothetical protein
MSRDDACSRCGLKETYRHLFWECVEAKKVWHSFNEYVRTIIGLPECEVRDYEDVFKVANVGSVSVIKVKVIQAMIQIERPSGWNQENIRKIAVEVKMIELYNSVGKNKFEATKRKWRKIR